MKASAFDDIQRQFFHWKVPQPPDTECLKEMWRNTMWSYGLLESWYENAKDHKHGHYLALQWGWDWQFYQFGPGMRVEIDANNYSLSPKHIVSYDCWTRWEVQWRITFGGREGVSPKNHLILHDFGAVLSFMRVKHMDGWMENDTRRLLFGCSIWPHFEPHGSEERWRHF